MPRLGIIGDSYSVGFTSGATGRSGDSYAVRCGRRLGWDDVWGMGWGGTGFLNDNYASAHNGKKYRDRLAADVFPYETGFDALLLQGSINDSFIITSGDVTAAQVTTEVGLCLDAVLARAGLANTAILVSGVMRPGNPTADDVVVNNILKAAVLARPRIKAFIDPIAEAWFYGTGKVGGTTGDGNADIYLASDGNHPTVAGHLHMGDHMARAIADRLGVSILQAQAPIQYPTYVTLLGGHKEWSAQAQGSFTIREDGAGTSGGGTSAAGGFYLDPAETPRLRLTGEVATNDTAPTSTFTFRLRPLGTTTGAAGVVASNPGTAVTGASAAIAAPAANTATRVSSADFDCPAAGFYCVEVQISVANMAANSCALNRFKLEARRTN